MTVIRGILSSQRPRLLSCDVRLQCGYDIMASKILNCRVRSEARCPDTWERLALTDDARTRLCQVCKQTVLLCKTTDDALFRGRGGTLVALEPEKVIQPQRSPEPQRPPEASGPDGFQHKLDRVRRPRRREGYEHPLTGEWVDLPLVVGVMADLSGQPKGPSEPLQGRRFEPIDRDNFNEVFAAATPRLALEVRNRLTEEATTLKVELTFHHIDDFDPARVAEQVGPLQDLLQSRRRLTELLGQTADNPELAGLLGAVLSNPEKAMALAKELGIVPPAGSTGAPRRAAEE
jgi:type VI secretion system protein ImpB